jgi:hypothetical protein
MPSKAKASTPDAPTPGAQFSAMLSRFPTEIIALVKRCMPKLRSAVPCTHEIVYDYSKSIVVTFGMSERGYEGIVSIAIHPDIVRLYFRRDLPDPKGLLEGAGSKVRSVIIEAASDLDHADIRALFKAAVRHAGAAGATFPPLSKTRSTQMIIKSASKNKTKKKKASKKRVKARHGAAG